MGSNPFAVRSAVFGLMDFRDTPTAFSGRIERYRKMWTKAVSRRVLTSNISKDKAGRHSGRIVPNGKPEWLLAPTHLDTFERDNSRRGASETFEWTPNGYLTIRRPCVWKGAKHQSPKKSMRTMCWYSDLGRDQFRNRQRVIRIVTKVGRR